jgi:hypothetical protein
LGKYNILICILGLVYLIYSFLFRNNVTVYNKTKVKVLLNKEKYLKLQFYFALINSIVMIIIGVITTMLNVITSAIVLVPMLFHLINYVFIFSVRKKGYIQYN